MKHKPRPLGRGAMTLDNKKGAGKPTPSDISLNFGF